MHPDILAALNLAYRRHYALGGSPSGSVTTQPMAGTNPATQQVSLSAPQPTPATTTPSPVLGVNPLTQPAHNPFDVENPNNAPPMVPGGNAMDQVKAVANNINKRIDTVDTNQTKALNQQGDQLQDQMKGYDAGQTKALNNQSTALNKTIDTTAKDLETKLNNQGQNLSNVISMNKKDDQKALQDQNTALTGQMNQFNDAQTKALQSGLQNQNTQLTNAFTTGDDNLSNKIDANQKSLQDQYGNLQKGLQGKFQEVAYQLALRNVPFSTDTQSYNDWVSTQNNPFFSNPDAGKFYTGSEASLIDPNWQPSQAASGGRITRAFGGNAFAGSQTNASSPQTMQQQAPSLIPQQTMQQQSQTPMTRPRQPFAQTENDPNGIHPEGTMYLDTSPSNPMIADNSPNGYAKGGAVTDAEIQELLDFPLSHYAEGGAVEEALEKTHGEHAIPLHQAIARSGYRDGGPISDAEIQELLDFPLGRHGYATDGAVEGDVEFAPDDKQFEKSGSVMAEEAPPVMPNAEASPIQHSHSWEHLPLHPYGTRYNEETHNFNTPVSKDIGFYGPVSVGEGDHVASEYSRGSDIGQYPSVAADMPEDLKVQALNAAQFDAPVPEEADKFAYNKAAERMAAGRSPFYEPGKDPYPKWSPNQYWEKPSIMPNNTDALKIANDTRSFRKHRKNKVR